MNVLTAIGKDKFELKAFFVSELEKGWKHLQFVFGKPIICNQMKIEFVEVTSDNFFIEDNKPHPSVGGMSFLKTEVPETTPIPPQTPLPKTPAAFLCSENNYRCDIKNEEYRPTHASISIPNFTNHS